MNFKSKMVWVDRVKPMIGLTGWGMRTAASTNFVCLYFALIRSQEYSTPRRQLEACALVESWPLWRMHGLHGSTYKVFYRRMRLGRTRFLEQFVVIAESFNYRTVAPALPASYNLAIMTSDRCPRSHAPTHHKSSQSPNISRAFWQMPRHQQEAYEVGSSQQLCPHPERHPRCSPLPFWDRLVGFRGGTQHRLDIAC